jgi:hypothetical protein
MTNTLTAKLTIADANNVIPGNTPKDGLTFTTNITGEISNSAVLAASGNSSVTLSSSTKGLLVIATAGSASVELFVGETSIISNIDFDGGGFIFMAEPIDGIVVEQIDVHAGSNGCSYSIYSWS